MQGRRGIGRWEKGRRGVGRWEEGGRERREGEGSREVGVEVSIE